MSHISSGYRIGQRKYKTASLLQKFLLEDFGSGISVEYELKLCFVHCYATNV